MSAEALRDLPTGVLVDGTWREAASGQTLPTYDPVTEEVLAEFAAGGPDDVEAAVRAARRQFDDGEWSRMLGPDRARVLFAAADLIERNGERLATIHSRELGIPIQAALAFDVTHTVEAFRYQGGWADKIAGRVAPPLEFGGRPTHSFVVPEPVGVVAAILPWNGPFVDGAKKLAPALAAGCTVVVKPAEQCLLSVLLLVQLLEEAGLPPGVVNVVPGTGRVAGEALIGHPGVDHISFTGSVEVGRHIQRVAADNFTRVTLELGGKSPTMIFADADLDNAIEWAAMGVFANQGQICAAGSRILVEDGIYDEVTAALGKAASAVRLGNPNDEGVSMGPLVTQEQKERVLGYIDAGREEGARQVGDPVATPERGYFVPPTIFADASNEMRIAREEIFGPVGTVIRFSDEREAVEIANRTNYGLAASIYTHDVSRAHRLARELRVGTVWVNAWGAVDMRLPWGGVKGSGIGREGGLEGLLEYTEQKTVRIVL